MKQLNTAMQYLSFVQGQGPVSTLKSIGSSNSLKEDGEIKSFDNVLAGFLGSGNHSETIKNEIPEKELEKSGIYGTLIENFLNLQKVEIETNEVLIELPGELDEDLQKDLNQLLLKIEEIETPKDLTLIKDKIINIFKENNVFPSTLIDEIFSEHNLNIKNLPLEEKEIFIKVLTQEFIEVIKESSKEDTSQVIQRVDLLKDLVQKTTNPMREILELSKNLKVPGMEPLSTISEESEDNLLSFDKGGNVKAMGAEVNSQKNPSSEETKTGTENSQIKPDLSFQKSLDNNINKVFETEEVQEKIEPKNIPKYIENQVKNSFKIGESGFREITVKIHPEHLGKIVLRISTTEDSDMTVKILAGSKNIKEFLDTNLTILRNNLENSGIKGSSLNIQVDFDKNFNHSNGSNQNFSRNPNKGERKELTDDLSFEERIESIFNNSGGLEVFA